jgi:hypothetical protein
MDTYLHIRVLFSMILGLGMSRLLGGVGRIVQHPRLYKVYWVHLVWTLFLFLYMIHFWWWEFRLFNIHVWTFPLYFFIALYAVLLFLLCVLFFPEEMADYTGFKDYFYSRRQWIFALMTLLFLADFALGFLFCSGRSSDRSSWVSLFRVGTAFRRGPPTKPLAPSMGARAPPLRVPWIPLCQLVYPLPAATRRINSFEGSAGLDNFSAVSHPATGNREASNSPNCTSTEAWSQ